VRAKHQRNDLIIFLAILTTGVVLIALGVLPESLATIAVGLSSLYAAWNSHEHARRRNDESQPGAPGLRNDEQTPRS
jgi:hypothetical protein